MSIDQPTPFEGKYEIIGKIAEGGMGAVYKVRHLLLDEIRVIKVMRPQAAESEEQRKRFVREAQTATKLRHPNIVTFHDFAVDESGTAYMVMEFIDGVTLAQLIRKGGPLPLPIALELAKQCLSALGYLHRRGIVHRDVSPDNILMAHHDETGAQVKLIDLGIAKVIQSEEALTVGDAFLGKLRYCSPEQLSAGSSTSTLDGRSDLFSFGIVLSEMLTGVCPLPGQSVQSIVAAHISGRLLSFEQTDPLGRVAPPLRELVEHALRTDPAARIQTAEEFAKRIAEVETREGVRLDLDALRKFTDQALAARPPSAIQVKPSDFRASALGPPSPRPSPASAYTKPVEDSASAALTSIEKTERWDEARKAPEPAAPASRRSRLWILAAAVVVAGILGYWARERGRAAGAGPSESVGPAAQPVPLAPSIAQPTAAKLEVTAPPASTTESVPASAALPVRPAEPTSVPRPPRIRASPGVPVIAARDLRSPQPPPSARAPSAERLRYCAGIEPTSYAQAATKERPAGFDASAGEIFRGPRPDAARITIQTEVNPTNPLEGQPFRVVARLVNGGDTSITLAKIEESAARARGGFQQVGSVATPATVQVGAALTIYSMQGALTEGNSYTKDLKVTDSVGDTWKTAIRIGVCPE